MLVAVGLQYVYERRWVDHATALGYFKANAFVAVFLCYVSLLDVPHSTGRLSQVCLVLS
jgi:hypothetical protein